MDSDGSHTVTVGRRMEDDAFCSVSKKLAWELGDYDFQDEGKRHTLRTVCYDSGRLYGSSIA